MILKILYGYVLIISVFSCLVSVIAMSICSNSYSHAEYKSKVVTFLSLDLPLLVFLILLWKVIL